jgi:hypothetical protein
MTMFHNISDEMENVKEDERGKARRETSHREEEEVPSEQSGARDYSSTHTIFLNQPGILFLQSIERHVRHRQ